MRKLGIALITTALLLGTVAVVGAQEDGADERVLFLGNSNISENGGVDDYFAGLVAADDDAPTMTIDSSIIMGGALAGHLSSAPDIIGEGGYSVIVLQGDIPWRKTSVDPFFDAARALDEIIDESGARTVFYMTWPYADSDWIDLDGIADAHRSIAAELGASVAPASVAMENASAERADLVMIDDTEHQTYHGAYLAAATIYATIFDRSPEGLSFVPDTITPEDANDLQRIAWETVQEWQQGETMGTDQ